MPLGIRPILRKPPRPPKPPESLGELSNSDDVSQTINPENSVTSVNSNDSGDTGTVHLRKKRTKRIDPDSIFDDLIQKTFLPLTRRCLISSIIIDPKKNLKPLNDLVCSLKQISISMYYLLNLHVLRCLKKGLPLQNLVSQTFYQHLGYLVTLIGKENQFKPPSGVPRDLLDSANIFRSLLPSNYKMVNRSHMTPFISVIARKMLTAVKNHFDTNIDARFSKYLQIKYNIQDRYQREHIVRRILYSKKHPSKFDSYLLNNILIQIYQKKKFGGQCIPKNIKPSTNLNVFVHFFHYMQIENESQGEKMYSLFPLSSQFIPDYIDISTSLTTDLFLLLENSHLKKDLTSLGKWEFLLEFNRLPRVNQAYFGKHLSTNGYAASVLYYKMPDDFPVSWKDFTTENREKQIEHLNAYKSELDKKKKIKYQSKNVIESDVIPESHDDDNDQIEKLDENEIEPNDEQQIMEDYTKYSLSDFKYFFANDPGGRFLYTIAVNGDNCEDCSDGCLCSKATKKVPKASRSSFKRCSAKEYFRLTHQKNYRDFLNKSTIKEIQELTIFSLKTSDYELYKSNVKEYLVREQVILAHYNVMEFRKRKFTAQIHKQKAFHTLGNRILDGKDASDVVIGWGDGSASKKGIKGNHLPNKEFRTFMERVMKVTIIDVNEHRTTKCCSTCGSETQKVKRWAKKEELIDKKGVKRTRIVETSKDDQNAFSCGIYAITRCNNNDCQITWERDKNAAINLRKVLIHKLRKLERPDYLKRKQVTKKKIKTFKTPHILVTNIPEPPKETYSISNMVKRIKDPLKCVLKHVINANVRKGTSNRNDNLSI